MKKYRIVKEGIERKWSPGTFMESFVVQRRFLWLLWIDCMATTGGWAGYPVRAEYTTLRGAVKDIAQRIKPKQEFKPRATSKVIWTTGENYPA